jgi:Lar family restriction alleviation protein
MEHLKPCPFCGATEESTVYETNSIKALYIRKHKSTPHMKPDETIYSVSCRMCGAESGSYSSGYNGLLSIAISEDEAISKAIEKWNQRKDV